MRPYGWEAKPGHMDLKWERFGHACSTKGRRMEKRRFYVAGRRQGVKGIRRQLEE